MSFLITPTITFSCLASVAHQADTRWLGQVVSDYVVIAYIGDQALDILLHGPESAHKNGMVKTNLHSHIHSHPLMHTPKTKSKSLNSLNVTPSLNCPLPVQSGGGRRPGSLADAPHDCSTSEASRLGQYWQKTFVDVLNTNFPTTMSFLTTPTITLSCLASAAPQADYWWLGQVDPDDVVIADIVGQALDIFLYGPESAHKNDIVTTFIVECLLYIPCWLHFHLGSFSYTSHAAFTFLWGVSPAHPMLPSFCFLLFFSFNLGSFSYTSHAGFFF